MWVRAANSGYPQTPQKNLPPQQAEGSYSCDVPETNWDQIFRNSIKDYAEADSPQKAPLLLYDLVNKIKLYSNRYSDLMVARVFSRLYLEKISPLSDSDAKFLKRPLPSSCMMAAYYQLGYHRQYCSSFIKANTARFYRKLNESAKNMAEDSKNTFLIRKGFKAHLLAHHHYHVINDTFDIIKTILDLANLSIEKLEKIPHQMIILNNLIASETYSEGITKFNLLVNKYLHERATTLGHISSDLIIQINRILVPICIFPYGKFDIVRTFPGVDEEIIYEMIVHGGYTPTMSEFAELDAILANKEEDELPKLRNIAEIDFKSFRDFLNCQSVKNFFSFKPNPSSEFKSQYILITANTKLIRGLAEPLIDIFESSTVLVKNMINGSLNRLQALLGLMIEYVDNHDKCSFINELIAEELQLILHTTLPYKEKGRLPFNRHHNSLHLIIHELNKYVHPKDKHAPYPNPLIKPLGLAFSSGMGSLNGILKVVSSLKKQPIIVTSSDSYFEIHHACIDMCNATHVSSEIYDKNLDIKPDLIHYCIRDVSGEAKSSTRYEYLCSNLAASLEYREVTQPLMVAIDITNDKLLSREIKTIVTKFETEIREKKLTIVLFGSGQKFYQFGADQLNAGIAIIYTAIEKHSQLFEELEGQLSGRDYQTLCHYLKYVPLELHQHVKLQYKIAAVLHHSLSKLANINSIALSPRLDRKSVFIEFEAEKGNGFLKTILGASKERNICILKRNGFGYNTPTICRINETKIRFFPGTIDNAKQVEIIKCFAIAIEFVKNSSGVAPSQSEIPPIASYKSTFKQRM